MPSPADRKPIQITDPVHAELVNRARYLRTVLGRAVTFSEVIERLLMLTEGSSLAGSPGPFKASADR